MTGHHQSLPMSNQRLCLLSKQSASPCCHLLESITTASMLTLFLIKEPRHLGTMLVRMYHVRSLVAIQQIKSPLDPSMLPDPKTAGQQAPGAGAGINKVTDIDTPDVGKAAKQATQDLPNPAEKAKGLGNPIDSVKGLFGQ